MSYNRGVFAKRAPPPCFIDIKGTFNIISHLARVTRPDGFFLSFKRVFAAKNGIKESLGALSLGIVLDPLVLQHLIHGIDGTHKVMQNGNLLLILDFDLFVQCSTALGHRGDGVASFFDSVFGGNAFAAQPERYGECPFGRWEDFKKVTPQPSMYDVLDKQTSELESLIDEIMTEHVGSTMEVGTLVRKLVWDLTTYSLYGVRPCEETKHMWEEFEYIVPKFDYAVRMAGLEVPYEWSSRMAAYVRSFTAWSEKKGRDRKANLEQFENQNDVLTTGLRIAPDKASECWK